jgi:hypothetical protein
MMQIKETPSKTKFTTKSTKATKSAIKKEGSDLTSVS